MKISILKCPYCGAEINSNTSGKDSIFCPFCGREISVDDCDTKEINVNVTDNQTVNKNIRKSYYNEGSVSHGVAKQMQHKYNFWRLIAILTFVLVSCLLFPSLLSRCNKYLGDISASESRQREEKRIEESIRKEEQRIEESIRREEERIEESIREREESIAESIAVSEGKIKISMNSSDLIGKDVDLIKKQLTAIGFTDVRIQKIKEFKPFRDNLLQSISVNGSFSFRESDFFPADVPIIIFTE